MSAKNVSSHAAELHKRAIVIDCHSDILMPIADGKIRLYERVEVPEPAVWEPPLELRGLSPSDTSFSPHTYYFGTTGQYSIPQFLEGGLTVQVCAIYLRNSDLERALQRGLEMTWWLHREAEESNDFELVTTVADIHRVKQEGRSGGILAFEGFEPLGFDLRFLDLFYKLGLRMASLTHSRRNFFADGQQGDVQTGGLTKAGRQAVKRMNELGIVIDLGHLNPMGFWEVLELTEAPLVYSHTAASKYFPLHTEDSPIHLLIDVSRGRERLEAIAQNGGVVGVIFYSQEDLDEVVTDIEYIIDAIGPDHVGLGSDLYGMEKAPKGLEDMSKVPAITKRLVQRGHSDETILKVLGGNYLRVFEQVWKNP
jgi:membrane dipeptidase